MPWFMVTWLSWSCPKLLFIGVIPLAAQPLAGALRICKPVYHHEQLANRDDARARVQALGSVAIPGLTEVGPDLRMTEAGPAWTETAVFP